MKRTKSPLHLSRSPLVVVVTEARFSAVMAIEKFVPDIQEQLRHKGFPRFVKNQIQEILVQQNAAPKVNVTDRFEFQNKEQSVGIVLTSNSVAVHTSRYTSFEDFEGIFATVLIVVNRVLQLSLLERVGLRYIDVVRVNQNAGEKLTDYLKPGLLGLDPEKIRAKDWIGRLEQSGRTECGKLVVKCLQHNQILPPDLSPSSLSYGMTLQQGEIVTLLDFDHFADKSDEFETKYVVAAIGELHDALDLAFREAVTDEALIRWGKEKSR